MRERLIELLSTAGWNLYTENRCKAEIADHLIANGVIVPPCKFGDTIWFELYGEIEAAVVYFCRGVLTQRGFVLTDASAKTANGIEVYFDGKGIGKAVFLTRAEAEQAVKDMQRGDGDGE